MATPSIYINLEDDVDKVVQRLRRQMSRQIVLVCPKRCFLFSDPINLRLLKKQADLLGKEVFILTMDEKGQAYATEAGLGLRFLPKSRPTGGFSDIRSAKQDSPVRRTETAASSKVSGVARMAKRFVPAAILNSLDMGQPAAPANLPETKRALEVDIVEVKTTDTFFPEPFEEQYKPAYAQPIRKNQTNRIITGIVAISLVIVLLLVFVVLPKATVVVYPKAELVTRDMEISMSANVQQINPSTLVLPAVKIQESFNISNKFQSQGKKQVGNKATGSVKIYNFTRSPLNLKAATTVLTVGAQTYSLISDVNGLRPTVYKNAKTKEVDLNSLAAAVPIVATDGGEAYNLPAGTRVEISNQVFGSKPQVLYAKTDSEITGGTTRYLSLISQDDYNAAKTALQAQALKQINDKLSQNGEVLTDGAYTMDTTSFVTDNPVGTQTPNFQATLQSKITGLAFRQDDLTNLVMQRIEQTLAQDKILEPNRPDQTSYKIKSLDLNNQLAVIQLHYQGQAVFNVDIENIAPELTGKSQSDVNELLRSRAEIDKVEITLAPVWQKNFPLFAGKINVSLGTTTGQ